MLLPALTTAGAAGGRRAMLQAMLGLEMLMMGPTMPPPKAMREGGGDSHGSSATSHPGYLFQLGIGSWR